MLHNKCWRLPLYLDTISTCIFVVTPGTGNVLTDVSQRVRISRSSALHALKLNSFCAQFCLASFQLRSVIYMEFAWELCRPHWLRSRLVVCCTTSICSVLQVRPWVPVQPSPRVKQAVSHIFVKLPVICSHSGAMIISTYLNCSERNQPLLSPETWFKFFILQVSFDIALKCIIMKWNFYYYYYYYYCCYYYDLRQAIHCNWHLL
jgi:hypothetical protein